jgi:DNA-binding GntR family transcriptional regulator
MTESTDAPSRPAESSAETAYGMIQRLIVVGELPDYSLITESELAQRTGCGRTPVREALQRLKLEGFVDVLPRRGMLVTPIDINRQLELLETRRPLEELMVSLAAVRATDDQRREMRELADQLEQAIQNEDRETYLAINRAIHALEAEAAHNRYLHRQIETIHSLSRRFWYSFIVDTESFSRAAKHHATTLRAIADGDPVAAKTACLELLDLLEDVSRRAIEIRSSRKGV